MYDDIMSIIVILVIAFIILFPFVVFFLWINLWVGSRKLRSNEYRCIANMLRDNKQLRPIFTQMFAKGYLTSNDFIRLIEYEETLAKEQELKRLQDLSHL